MQIRIANKQDEKRIASFIEDALPECGLKLDLSSDHADLKNVEANYFGQDGVFLLAEQDEKIIGIAAASMIDQDACALRRIAVSKNFRGRGVGGQMLSIIVSIAKRLDYKELVTTGSAAAEPVRNFLERAGFKPVPALRGSQKSERSVLLLSG